MARSLKDLLAAARESVPAVSVEEAQGLLDRGNTLVIDVRDAPEVAASGKVPGALNVSRGMLEFRADPHSPLFESAFARDKTIIVYCGSGGRAALAGKTLRDLGYEDVRNLGGFPAWVEAGGAVDRE